MTQAEAAVSGLWHAVLLYHGTGELEARARQFAAAGLRAGGRVLIAGAGLRGLRARMGSSGAWVRWADMTGGSNPGRLIGELAEFAGRDPGRPAWYLQHAAWGARPAEELWEVIRHEARVNLALAGCPARMLCSTPRGWTRS